MDGIILAQPTHYRIDYAINPLTSAKSKVDHAKAMAQFERLKARYEKHGISTHVIETATADPAGKYPDFVYVSNSALILRGWPKPVAVLARYAHPERQGEQDRVGLYLKDVLGFKVIELPDRYGLFFEGQGDCRWSHDGQHLWFAYGAGRSTLAGIEAVEDAILREAKESGWQPPKFHRLQIVEKRTYHMDLCFCPLPTSPNGKALVHMSSFAPAGRRQLEHVFGKQNLIDVPYKYLYLCNSVWLPDGTLVIPKLDSGQCRGWVHQKTGMRVEEANVAEFHLAGGSVSCMTLPIWSNV